MIISSLPICESDDSGPVAGAVVMAQFLDADRLAMLRERTEVRAFWTPLAELEQWAPSMPRNSMTETRTST